ncbi:hypothetical protein [Pedobacter sp. GR22-10]|uniref:hypothetical protein n=1 Tax=Pedobacter sp. GR22-10 TaxID=2994472 RepID=UPI0022468837|nr:hypothetical protein [Pedobacter sp. GR22-10]MCX2431634.1 hypothetical protein [Pedobacter sp. GR22-10]
MKSFFSLVALTLLSTTQLLSQKVSMPINSAFYDSDMKNFWVAFDMLNKDCKNPFHEFYIAKGTKGLESFMAGRIVNADSLFNTVLRRKDDYEKARTKTENMLEKKLECLQAYKKLKELYRNAIFPPVYFLIGRYNSGGHSSRAGIVIGAEMVDSAFIPFLVSHELIHYQQKKIPKKNSIFYRHALTKEVQISLLNLFQGKVQGKKL